MVMVAARDSAAWAVRSAEEIIEAVKPTNAIGTIDRSNMEMRKRFRMESFMETAPSIDDDKL